MRDKERDVPFCSVNRDKVLTARPKIASGQLELLYKWITERYTIRINKDVLKKPKPWTKYEPLLYFKFTNVFREDDRETKNLLKHVTFNPNLTYEEKILNSFLFRAWNKWESMERFGGPFKVSDFYDFNALLKEKEALMKSAPADYLWYTNAFNCGGLKSSWAFPALNLYGSKPGIDSTVVKVEDLDSGECLSISFKELKTNMSVKNWKIKSMEGFPTVDASKPLWEPRIPLRMFWLAKHILDTKLIDELKTANCQQCALNTISKVRGIATFLSYQVFVDLTYIPEFPFSENHFVVSGPGCSLGLNLFFENKDGMTDEECLFWMVENQEKIFSPLGYDPQTLLYDRLPEDQRLNLMSFENCFCEFSKLNRIVKTGRARISYPGNKKGFFE
jgi:hypothetical protein